MITVVDCGKAAPQEAIIKINPNEKFQTITGWEATAQAGEIHAKAFDKYKENLFDEAVYDLGINRLRLEIRSGAENPEDFFTEYVSGRINEKQFRSHYYEIINDNDDPFSINEKGFNFSELDSTIEKVVLPIKKRLAARGEKLFLNLNYIDFLKGRGASDIRHKTNAEEYAEFMQAAFLHMRQKYDLVPDAIEVILEPDNRTGWTGTDIGRAIVATAKRLGKNNFNPTFIAPSTTNAANTTVFIDEIADVPGAMQFISEFSYHRYCCASEKVLRQIAERAEKYNKQTAMLEWIGADYKTLHEDLKTARNSAWQQYTLAFPDQPDNGAQYYRIDDEVLDNPVITLGSRTKFLRQYFHFIHAGAQRIGAETSNKALDPLAFINKNGRYVVVIKADARGTVLVENLPAGNYGISYMTSEQAGFDAPDKTIKANEPLKAQIPAVGVLTIYAKTDS